MENVLFTRQRHEADRAGLHYDYRIVVGDKALSWATKKELPETGKSIMLWEQPVHTADYALSNKVIIPKGQYGAGITTLDWVKKGQADIKDGQITVHTNEGRYLLKHMPTYQDGTGWLFKKLRREKMGNKYLEKIAEMDKVHPIRAKGFRTYTHNNVEYHWIDGVGIHPETMAINMDPEYYKYLKLKTKSMGIPPLSPLEEGLVTSDLAKKTLLKHFSESEVDKMLHRDKTGKLVNDNTGFGNIT